MHRDHKSVQAEKAGKVDKGRGGRERKRHLHIGNPRPADDALNGDAVLLLVTPLQKLKQLEL